LEGQSLQDLVNVRQTSVCRLLGKFEPRVINDKLKFVGHFW